MSYLNSTDFFYILVEGEPESPEVPFLVNIIDRIELSKIYIID